VKVVNADGSGFVDEARNVVYMNEAGAKYIMSLCALNMRSMFEH